MDGLVIFCPAWGVPGETTTCTLFGILSSSFLYDQVLNPLVHCGPVCVDHLFLAWRRAHSSSLILFLCLIGRFFLSRIYLLLFLGFFTALSSLFLLLSVLLPSWSCLQDCSSRKISSLQIYSLSAAIQSLTGGYSRVDNLLIASLGMIRPAICLITTPTSPTLVLWLSNSHMHLSIFPLYFILSLAANARSPSCVIANCVVYCIWNISQYSSPSIFWWPSSPVIFFL